MPQSPRAARLTFRRWVLVAAAAAAAAASPGALAQKPQPAGEALRPVQTVWPLPPDPPRLRYVGVYGGSEDVGAVKKKRSLSLKEALLGRDRVGAGAQNLDVLQKPFGVAVDGFGRIIVADSARPAVVVMDLDRRSFLTVGEGTRQAHFKVPVAVAVDEENNIYVGDTGLHGVLVFGPDLAYQRTIGGQGEMQAPSGLALDESRGRLYVADTRHHQLLVYALEGGRLTARVGKRGVENGQFNFPTGVAVAPDGRVYVTDTMNCRVQVFSPDLRFLSSFGSLGVHPGQFRRPKGIAVDAEGTVYVVDSDFNNFQLFSREGELLMWVGEMGRRPGQLLLPAGIAVDRLRRRVVVGEQLNGRVQVFERVGPSRP